METLKMAIKYSFTSIFAGICGIATTTFLGSHPYAAAAGTLVTSLIDGVQPSKDEKTLRKKLIDSIDVEWGKIKRDYRLSDKCLSDLKNEIMGEGTSLDEFIRNVERDNSAKDSRSHLENCLKQVITHILVRHKEELNKDPEYKWDSVFILSAARNIAVRIINAVESVIKEGDDLIILLAIARNRTADQEEHKEINDTIKKTGEDIVDKIGQISTSTTLTLTYEHMSMKIAHKKKTVLRQLLFPWFKHSPKYQDVFPELFIDPHFTIDGTNEVITDVSPFFTNNLMILGDAGAGKSTFLRTWFVFKENEKRSCREVKEVLLLDAKEYLIKESFLNDIIQYLRNEHNDHYLLLIDAIDEAFYNDYPRYKSFILQLQELDNCSIWMGCRKDYYNLYSGGDGMNISDHNFYIQKWGPEEADKFIHKYSIIRGLPDLPQKIQDMRSNMGDKSIIEELMRNPFQLSIIVFLAEDPEKIHIKGRYDLYEQFMTRWNKHEKLRGTSIYSEEEKEAALFEAALCIYCNRPYIYNEVAENDTGVNALFQNPDVEVKWGDDHPVANEFYHRSLAEFILAKTTIKAMINFNVPTYEEIFRRICKTKMKDDVTNFILDKFLTIDIEDRYAIKNNLQSLYESLPDNRDTLSTREQIIYFITRLDIDASDFVGKVIESNPKNNMIRLSLAYGCTLLKDKRSWEYALNFARAIVEDPNGEEATINRAWAVIYYGDFHGEEKGLDEYSYRDEEKGSWKKVRENKISRFDRDKPRRKDLRFWILDIPLFHNFLIERGWNDISESEYRILEKIQFTSDVFYDDEKQFLIKEHKKLLDEYYCHLWK